MKTARNLLLRLTKRYPVEREMSHSLTVKNGHLMLTIVSKRNPSKGSFYNFKLEPTDLDADVDELVDVVTKLMERELNG